MLLLGALFIVLALVLLVLACALRLTPSSGARQRRLRPALLLGPAGACALLGTLLVVASDFGR